MKCKRGVAGGNRLARPVRSRLVSHTLVMFIVATAAARANKTDTTSRPTPSNVTMANYLRRSSSEDREYHWAHLGVTDRVFSNQFCDKGDIHQIANNQGSQKWPPNYLVNISSTAGAFLSVEHIATHHASLNMYFIAEQTIPGKFLNSSLIIYIT